MKKTKNISKKWLILSLVLVILLAIGGLGVYGYNEILDTDFVYEGIHIDEFDIGHMNEEETLEFLKEEKESEIDEKTMTLFYEEEEYNVNLREVGFYFDYDKAIDEAAIIGREGTIIDRLKEIYRVKEEGREIALESDFDKTKAKNIVSKIAEDINREKVEATFNFNGGDIEVTEDAVGKVIKEEELINKINNNVYTLEPIDIPVEDIKPSMTKEVLARVNGIIGEFATSYGNSPPGRKENIRISSNAIKGNLLMPGETFSFNGATGPISAAAGYQEASIILDGDFSSGVGGGVCQTSTTFYNALLLSDVTIVERNHHSIPIGYVSMGQDAAVAGTYLDVKFRNDFDFPIYLDSKVLNDRVYMYVYGDKNTKNYNVVIDPQIVETVEAEVETVKDETLSSGKKELVQKGRTGYKVHTFKSRVRDGKVLSRDLITKDFYKPKKFIYRLGSGKEKVVDKVKEPEELEEIEEPEVQEVQEELEEEEE